MSWMQATVSISAAAAWPVCIMIVLVVLKRTKVNPTPDEAIAALSPTVRQAVRTSGITVYPTSPRTGKVMLDRPIRARDVRKFDKHHPGFERYGADL